MQTRLATRIMVTGSAAVCFLAATMPASAEEVKSGVIKAGDKVSAEVSRITAGVAAERPAKEVVPGMVNKAVRGGINLVTGIVEFPMQIYKGYDSGVGFVKNKPASKAIGTVLGFFSGTSHSAARVGWGAMELFGFWSANPANNEGVGVPFDSEYAWEWGKKYSVFEPSLREGLMPYPRKLGHGLVNGVAGIAEIPGQIVKGSRDGNVATGAVRGVWYFLSRELYGFGNLFMCLVPNPPDNPGYAFNGTYPWSALVED